MADERVAVLSNENANLKVLLMDTLFVLANSAPRVGSENEFNAVVDRIINTLGLSDEEVRHLIGN
jgi:hypothetical protein